MLEWVHGGDVDIMEIGKKIAQLRKEKGLSQKALAEKAGLGIASIQRIEYGSFRPKSATIRKIASALGVASSDIDDELNDLFQRWDEQYLPQIKAVEELCKHFPDMQEEDYNAFRAFLSLNADGKQKASEYIELLMLKYKK